MFQEKYSDYAKNIKPELDACQIEIITNVHNSLDDAVAEAITLTKLVSDISEELGYTLSKSPAPNYPEEQRKTSDAEDEKTRRHYKNIDTFLREKNARHATNIAGIHINIGHPDKNIVFALHHNLSNTVARLLAENNLDDLAFNPDRYKKYKQVVDALGTSMVFEPEDGEYCDKDGNPLDQGHSLVRLKQYGDQYVTEIRTPHGGYDEESVRRSINPVNIHVVIPAMDLH